MISQRYFNGMHMRINKTPTPRDTIFYIHGLGESGLCLEGIMDHPLLKGFTHLSADLPGYGKSPWPEEPLSLSRYADLLEKHLVFLNAGRVVLVGHSMGGVIGTLLCERYPERMRLFINVEGNVSVEDCTFSCIIAAHSFDEFAGSDFGRFRDEIYERGIHERALRWYHAGLLMCDPRSIYMNSLELVNLSESEELAGRLGSLKIPVSYVWGDPGGTGEYSLGQLRAQGIPMACVLDAGHWPFIDQPDAFAETILDIISPVEE